MVRLGRDRLSGHVEVDESFVGGLGGAEGRSTATKALFGTHQGAVSQAHLDYYFDEFTLRFNRRRWRHRGLFFFRLVQQAVAVGPVPYALANARVESTMALLKACGASALVCGGLVVATLVAVTFAWVGPL